MTLVEMDRTIRRESIRTKGGAPKRKSEKNSNNEYPAFKPLTKADRNSTTTAKLQIWPTERIRFARFNTFVARTAVLTGGMCSAKYDSFIIRNYFRSDSPYGNGYDPIRNSFVEF